MIAAVASIPSPPSNGFHVGSAFIHYYGVMYVVGIALAVAIVRRRWRAFIPGVVIVAVSLAFNLLGDDVALWSVPAGIVGGRIYFDVTTPKVIGPHWYGPLAVWQGGLGIWGGIALATVVGIWRLHRAGAGIARFMDATAPALLVAQAVGRVGNYFNQELFGGPTSLPWALHIDVGFRPPGYEQYATFHPTFLYELLFDLAWAAVLVWIGHHTRERSPGLFALYVAGYSAFRIFEESLRVDYSEHFLGLRLNTFVSIALTAAGLAWFAVAQRRGRRQGPATPVPLGDHDVARPPDRETGRTTS